MRRDVQLTSDGFSFEVLCDTCPLKVHSDALGQKQKACTAGLITNMQGPVPINTCENFTPDSVESAGKGKKAKLSLECTK